MSLEIQELVAAIKEQTQAMNRVVASNDKLTVIMAECVAHLVHSFDAVDEDENDFDEAQNYLSGAPIAR